MKDESRVRRHNWPVAGWYMLTATILCFGMAILLASLYGTTRVAADGTSTVDLPNPQGPITAVATLGGFLFLSLCVYGLRPNRVYSTRAEAIDRATEALKRAHRLIADLSEQADSDTRRLEQVRREHQELSAIPDDQRTLHLDQLARDRRMERRAIAREVAYLVIGVALGWIGNLIIPGHLIH